MAVSPEAEEEMKVAYRALWAEASALGEIWYEFREDPAEAGCSLSYENEIPCIAIRTRYVPPCPGKVNGPADARELFELAFAVESIIFHNQLPPNERRRWKDCCRLYADSWRIRWEHGLDENTTFMTLGTAVQKVLLRPIQMALNLARYRIPLPLLGEYDNFKKRMIEDFKSQPLEW